ncbi:Uncharacterised protein [Streptococcus pneumoniae]|nr:Uncharacterised protein [Streptococcus pneumoniae]
MTELKDRLQVADIEKWDLTDIYHTIEQLKIGKVIFIKLKY